MILCCMHVCFKHLRILKISLDFRLNFLLTENGLLLVEKYLYILPAQWGFFNVVGRGGTKLFT